MKTAFVVGYTGFGDNLNARPLVKDLSSRYDEVYIETPAPQFFHDIPNVYFVHPSTSLRTQNKNMNKFRNGLWKSPPADAHIVRWGHSNTMFYREKLSVQGACYKAMLLEAGLSEKSRKCVYNFDLPIREEWLVEARRFLSNIKVDKPICFVHRPTIRKEWKNTSRNPKIETFQWIIDAYKDRFFFLSIADLGHGEEMFDGELKGVDYESVDGSLSLDGVMGLMKLSDIVLCSPSCFMLLGIALKVKTMCLFGGSLPPEMIVDKNLQDLSKFSYCAPDPFCRCMKAEHDCSKTIPKEIVLESWESLVSGNKPKSYGDTKVSVPSLSGTGRLTVASARQLKAPPTGDMQIPPTGDMQIPPNPLTITIAIPAGLGDMYWVCLKLADYKRRNKISKLRVCIHEDCGHTHNCDFLRMIPFIDEVISISPVPWEWKLPPDSQRMVRTREDLKNQNWKDDFGVDYAIQFNTHLEQGRRIEEALPEYKCDWNLPINIPKSAFEFADSLKRELGGKMILIYPSSIGANANWSKNHWSLDSWIEVIKGLNKMTRSKVVLVGREWDAPYSEKLRRLDVNKIIHSILGQTSTAEILALLKRSDGVVGFPSGLPIMATHYHVPTVMFIPDKIKFSSGFSTCWVNPEVLKSGIFLPLVYGSPKATPRGVINHICKWLRKKEGKKNEILDKDAKPV